jgi:transcriptional regulator with XRE-family HTH domain
MVHILEGMAKKQKDDQVMEKVRTLFEESGLSLVDLGRKMGYPERTARQSAWQFMKTNDPRMSMLRRFADAIGVRFDQLTTRGKRMSRKLQDELTDCDCAMDAIAFRELLEERKAVTSPAWSIDELVCHPDNAKEFCNTVREVDGCENLTDDIILRTLMNIRRSH